MKEIHPSRVQDVILRLGSTVVVIGRVCDSATHDRELPVCDQFDSASFSSCRYVPYIQIVCRRLVCSVSHPSRGSVCS